MNAESYLKDTIDRKTVVEECLLATQKKVIKIYLNELFDARFRFDSGTSCTNQYRSDNAASDNAASDNAAPDNAAYDNAASHNTASENAVSDNIASNNTACDNTARHV